MGMTIWVSKEDEEDNWDHSLILSEEKTLTKLAHEIGVTKLSAFYDNSILEEELGRKCQPNYSSAKELETSLIGVIKAINEIQSEKLNKTVGLIDELADCLKKVKIARENNIKVRFSLVP